MEDYEFVDCNRAALKMLGYDSLDQLLRTHPSEISPETQPDGRSSREKSNEILASASERGSQSFEWEHLRADGSTFFVEVSLTVIPRPEGKTLHVVWRDLGQRRRLERELRQAQKLEALGRLAGGVAHDFNNLLTVMLGHSQLLCEELAENEALLDSAQEIKSASDMGARLVQQLLVFSRDDKLQATTLNVRTVLLELAPILNRLLGEGVSLEQELSEVPLSIACDSAQLEQVAMNLVTNARDAMPDGGLIQLRLTRVLVPSDEAPLRLEEGEYARLRVTDAGVGMSEATIAKAFDPFFTTKDVEKGTGLGLATVYGVAERWGGTVLIDSTLGQGTSVSVYFPAVATTHPK